MQQTSDSSDSGRSSIFAYLNSIKTKLVMSFIFIALLPLVYISYTMLRNASDGLLNVIVDNSLAHSRKAVKDLLRFVENQTEIVKALKKDDAAKSADMNGFSATIKEYTGQFVSIEKVFVIDKNNQILCASGEKLPEYKVDYRNALNELNARPVLLRSFSNAEGRRFFALITRLQDDSRSDYGLLVVELNSLQIRGMLEDAVVGSSTRAYLLDENDKSVVALPDKVRHDLDLIDGKLKIPEYGVFSIEDKRLSQPLLASLLPVVGQGWKILLVQNQQEVYYMVETFKSNLYGILLLTIIIAVIIAFVISQNIALPILQVTHGANELAAGKFDVRINVKNTDEIGQLANNFNFMADSLNGKMEELRLAYDELHRHTETIEKNNIELDRKVFEIGILYKIGKTMGKIGLDLERLLDVIIDKAIEAVDAQRGSLMLIDENQEALELQRVRIWDSQSDKTVAIEDFKRNIKIKPGEGVAGKVLQTGKMLIINDPTNHPDFKQYEKEENQVNQLVCVPLKVKNMTFGVINLVNRKDGKDFASRDTNLLQTMANQAALVLDNTKLFKLAITDGLTDLFMVRHFKIKLNEEIKRAKRYNKIFSIVFFDIDHFKKFNDTYGHQVGDEVLKQVAKIFKNAVREDLDIAARYGGEEMIAMLPETDAKGAYKVAERLRKRIAEYEFEGYETPLHVTISIGIAEYPKHDTEAMELIKKADTALYLCKEKGRNQTSIYAKDMGVVSEK
ncbi:MAG: diguanylate cyclase [Candidatus Rifleibacteriota bacterium]